MPKPMPKKERKRNLKSRLLCHIPRFSNAKLGLGETSPPIALEIGDQLAFVIKSQDIYRCLAQYSADGFILSDRDGVVVSCNPAFVKLVGRQESDIVGQPLLSYVDSEINESSSKDSRTAAPLPPHLVLQRQKQKQKKIWRNLSRPISRSRPAST